MACFIIDVLVFAYVLDNAYVSDVIGLNETEIRLSFPLYSRCSKTTHTSVGIRSQAHLTAESKSCGASVRHH